MRPNDDQAARNDESGTSLPSSLLLVIGAASAWWAARRPIGWTLDQHLAEPCVNTGPSRAEAALAKAVAAHIAKSATAASESKERA